MYFSIGFAFADDVALVTPSIDDAQRLSLAVDKVSSEIGLMLNKYMIVSGDPDVSNSKFDLKSADDSILKWVEDFKYLGLYVGEGCGEFLAERGRSILWMEEVRRAVEGGCL